MKLIVGLGNPGKEYEMTRHNIGFYFLDLFANKNNISFKEKFNGLYAKVKINDEDVILLKPQTYMNLSGESVIMFKNYFKIDSKDILVIHDDLDLEFGRIKLKENGSSGGHNGIKNIILNLNTENFKRLKIGISKSNLVDTKDYVLGHFTKEEQEELKIKENEVINIIEEFFKIPFNDLMSKYNRR